VEPLGAVGGCWVCRGEDRVSPVEQKSYWALLPYFRRRIEMKCNRLSLFSDRTEIL
jgi:hypothetical protein